MTFGEKLKRFRLMNDIRQEDMAETLNISRATLINYEKGHTTINIDVLDNLKIAYPDFAMEENIKKPKIIQDNIIDFRVLFDVIKSKKNNIILSTIISAIIGVSFSFLFTKYYSSEISLYPEKKSTLQGLGQFQSLASNFGMNMPDNNQNINIPDVVKSRLIANKVLDEKWLKKNGKNVSLYELWEMEKSPLFSLITKTKLDSAYIKEKAVKIFSNHIEVLEDRLTGLIKIKVKLEDPLISSNVANFIGRQVQLYIQKANSAKSTKEKLFISDRLKIVKDELESSEQLLKDFKERNRGYEDSPELFMMFSRLFRVSEAKKQVYLTLQQQLELARIEEVKQSSILHILDDAVPPSRKSAPNRFLFLIIFTILGFSLTTLLTVLKY
jgi:uncharacterized protein involved in exopolysaccharide biosynthesis/DNA-binding XRE family transcriptional regulator